MTSIAELIRTGALVPVQVFGALGCCPTCDVDETVCPICQSEREPSYGLCDRFSTHAPSASDCNRAEYFLLRPSDEAMDDPVVRAALGEVLDETYEAFAMRPT